MSHGAITIVGLGPGDSGLIPLAAWEALKTADLVFLRTARHPAVEFLRREGITFSSGDEIYEEAETFEEVYDRIVEQVLKEACSGKLVAYAVPGHPLVAEESVRRLMDRARDLRFSVRVIPAPSFLDAVYVSLGIDPTDGLRVLDGYALGDREPSTAEALIVAQVHNQYVAGELRLWLMRAFPANWPVKVVRSAGVVGREGVTEIPLWELDKLDWLDHLCCVYVPPLSEAREGERRTRGYTLDPLAKVVERLRGEHGCPWDRKQTHESLRPYIIEETYEVVDAIDRGNMHKLCEEMGDLLLQIVLHARIAAENGFFDLKDVVKAITAKMIRRHPHVFGGLEVEEAAEVVANWERIKREERADPEASIVDDIPRHLPALMRAEKVQRRVSRVGFDWEDAAGALAKVREETEEVVETVASGDRKALAREIGDLLFSIVNYARFYEIDPEKALTQSVDRFITRFKYIEERVQEAGLRVENVTLEELDRLWNEAKGGKQEGK